MQLMADMGGRATAALAVIATGIAVSQLEGFGCSR